MPISRGANRTRIWFAVGVAVLVFGALVVGLELTTLGGDRHQSIKVARLYLDQVDAPSGMAYYVMEINASNNGATAWHFDPSFLIVASNSSATYPSNGSYNGTALLGTVDLASGHNVVGKVAFEMPANQVPTHLSYSDSNNAISIKAEDVPVVSSVASKFNYNAQLTVNGTGPTVQAGGWGFGSLIMNGVIENNTLVFFSGQTVQVNMWFEYLKRPVDPATITIQSVTASNGFQILGIDKPVPFTMMGWGAQAGIVLLLRIPPGQHIGNIDIAVLVSA